MMLVMEKGKQDIRMASAHGQSASQMPDVGDMELLRDYDRQGSEPAFAGLVRRHINLV